MGIVISIGCNVAAFQPLPTRDSLHSSVTEYIKDIISSRLLNNRGLPLTMQPLSLIFQVVNEDTDKWYQQYHNKRAHNDQEVMRQI